jgi:hypothetical protein
MVMEMMSEATASALEGSTSELRLRLAVTRVTRLFEFG